VELAALAPESGGCCLETAEAFAVPRDGLPEVLPGCLMGIQYVEWLRLLRRMLANGVVSLVSARGLLHWKGHVVTTSLFRVPKSAGSMRLILDRRRQKPLKVGLLEALHWLDIPPMELSRISRLTRHLHGGMWAEMILGPGDHVSIHMDDLQDNYYFLATMPRIR
jgi:hypothetical protein